MRLALVFFVLLFPLFAHAAVDTEYLEKARVLEVVNEQHEIIPGTDTPATVQTLRVEVLEGEEKGSIFTFQNDFTKLSPGDVFFLRHTYSAQDDFETFSVADPYRMPVLYVLLAIFVLFAFMFGGLQGIRGLASLVGSMVFIFLFLIPGISSGYSPLLVSIGVASLIVVVGSYITHGFNRTTTAAVLGMIVTVVASGLGAWYAVHAAQLSGFSSDEITFLHFQFNGGIDLIGLLTGGILIGLLGVLYDIAIGQAIAVEELVRAAKHYTKREIYQRAIRIGKEHIGALINTLAIAYVGASLPLLLLFQFSSAPIEYIVNGEIFATEIIRILIGSIGVILAVPMTTLIATYMLQGKEFKGEIKSHHGHRH